MFAFISILAIIACIACAVNAIIGDGKLGILGMVLNMKGFMPGTGGMLAVEGWDSIASVENGKPLRVVV